MPIPNYQAAIFTAAEAGGTLKIAGDLHLFRVPKNRFRAGQSYGLLVNGGTVLIDAVHEVTKPAVDALLAHHPPKALLLTHSDLIEQAFGSPEELTAWLGNVPVIIHSKDSGNLSGLMPLETSTALIADLGFFTYHIPGHTPGSTAYLHRTTGYLFTGDAIVGNNYEKPAQEFTHPPILEENYPDFVYGWMQVPLNMVNAVLPLHGQPSFGPEAAQAARDAALLEDKVMMR